MGPFDASWLGIAVSTCAVLLVAALGEMISERGGILNVGIEGMVIMGAFGAFLTAWWSGSLWVGVAGGSLAGCLLAAAMALLAVNARADQVVAGIGLYILAVGVTSFANQQIFTQHVQVQLTPMGRMRIPGLAAIPGVGGALFNQTPLVYLAFLAVPLTALFMYRTTWGLALRAAGESPESLAAAGYSVAAVRWGATLVAGAGAGLAGSMLSVGSVGIFNDGMTGGRGFLALAAVVFGRWKPGGVLLACFIFGGADALQLRLQAVGEVPRQVWVLIALVALAGAASGLRSRRVAPLTVWSLVSVLIVTAMTALALVGPHWTVPSQFWLMLPYAVTLLALAGFAGRTGAPATLGRPVADREGA